MAKRVSSQGPLGVRSWVYIYKTLQEAHYKNQSSHHFAVFVCNVEGTWNHHLVINPLKHERNSWVIDTIHQAVADQLTHL